LEQFVGENAERRGIVERERLKGKPDLRISERRRSVHVGGAGLLEGLAGPAGM